MFEPRLASQAIAVQKTCQFATSASFVMHACSFLQCCPHPPSARSLLPATPKRGCAVTSRFVDYIQRLRDEPAGMLIMESSHRMPGLQAYLLLEGGYYS